MSDLSAALSSWRVSSILLHLHCSCSVIDGAKGLWHFIGELHLEIVHILNIYRSCRHIPILNLFRRRRELPDSADRDASATRLGSALLLIAREFVRLTLSSLRTYIIYLHGCSICYILERQTLYSAFFIPTLLILHEGQVY
jgi:hypothetical protein